MAWKVMAHGVGDGGREEDDVMIGIKFYHMVQVETGRTPRPHKLFIVYCSLPINYHNRTDHELYMCAHTSMC